MASLKELKNRISSVKSTQKITKAMQMVAAAKLRKAEEAASSSRPYSERMVQVLSNLASAYEQDATAPKLLVGTGADDTHLLIVAAADRGLCGGFNGSIVRMARERIVELQKLGKTVKLFTVGKKAKELMVRLYGDLIVAEMDFSGVRDVGFEQAEAISDKVFEMFEAGEIDTCSIFYSNFKSVIQQIPTAARIIPADIPEGVAQPDLKGAIFEYEPDEETILAALLPRYVRVQILRALLENAASEQGARMSAMDNATRNAGDMIDKLNLQYNRTRQAQITTELIEIISGAEAL